MCTRGFAGVVRAAVPAMLAIGCGPAGSAESLVGETLFKQHCAACHQADGTGVPGLAPPLANALAGQLASPRAGEYLAHVLVAGLVGPVVSAGQNFNSAMPAVAQLSDDEIVAIANFVARALNGATEDRVTRANVIAARERRGGPADSLRLRRALLSGQP
jgi:mono/diheme cytochrome c family protein